MANSIFKLDINESEKSNFYFLFINSFFTGLATSFYLVATSSYFISNLSISQLPVSYIFSGIFGYFLVYSYKKIIQIRGILGGNIFVGLFYLIICFLIFYFRIHGSDNYGQIKWIAFLGFMCILPFSSVFALIFSSQSLQIFNLGQGKRLIALVGLGEIIASILAYLIAPFLTKLCGNTAYLFLFSSGFILLSLPPLIALNIRNESKLSKPVKKSSDEKVNFSLLFRENYYFIIALFTLISVILIYLIDYSYMLSVKFLSLDSHIDSAILISIIFTLVKIGELISSSISAKFNSQYGLLVSLILLPVILVICSILGLVVGLFISSTTFIIIAFLLFNKWSDRVIRKGILTPSQKVLFQVSEPQERIKVQTLIDGGFSQISTFISGVLLFIVSSMFINSSLYSNLFIIAGIILVFSLLWVIITKNLFNAYKIKIQAFLSDGKSKISSNSYVKVAENKRIQHFLSTKSSVHVDLIVHETKLLLDQETKHFEKFYLQKISTYNPKFQAQLDQLNSTEVFRKLKIYFYENKSFESRWAIIKYASIFSSEQKEAFLLENYSNLNHHLQFQLLKELNKNQWEIQTQSRFQVSEFAISCCQIILWCELSIFDLQELNLDHLKKELHELREKKILHLFEILKCLFDSRSIELIIEVWTKSTFENENANFVLELLENLLNDDLKKIIVPVLSDISMSSKIEKLESLLDSHLLGPELRLKDVIFKNVNIVDAYLKEIALNALEEISKNSLVFLYFKSDQNPRLEAISRNDSTHYHQTSRAILQVMNLDHIHLSYFSKDELMKSYLILNGKSDQDQSASFQKRNSSISLLTIEENGVSYRIDPFFVHMMLTAEF